MKDALRPFVPEYKGYITTDDGERILWKFFTPINDRSYVAQNYEYFRSVAGRGGLVVVVVVFRSDYSSTRKKRIELADEKSIVGNNLIGNCIRIGYLAEGTSPD